MIYVILPLIGFFLGWISTLYYFKSVNSQEKLPDQILYQKRGIYTEQIKVTDPLGYVSHIDVQFEVREIEKTSTKSKIEIIKITPSSSKLSSVSDISRLRELLNHKWVNVSDVEWIEDDLSEKRNKKIDELLK